MKTIHFSTIDSTNTYLLHNYAEMEHFTFVSADLQTAGKGRNSRVWKSESGSNLLFSLLLKEKAYFEAFRGISIVSAYSIAQVLKSLDIANVTIKWPNDVYVNDSKVCGILLQGKSTDQLQCLVVGIGLNVNQTEFEGEYLHQPTSIALELAKKVNIDELKTKVYTCVMNNLIALVEGKDFLSEITEIDYLKGKEAYAVINGEKKQVKVVGIASDYSLCVDDGKNQILVDTDEITFHI